MKKLIIGIFSTLAIIVVLVLVFKEPLIEYAKEVLTADMFVAQDDDAFDPGVEINKPFPLIDASYNNRKLTSINEFSGTNGTVFVVSRSLVWCPYCMKQMAELNNNIEAFEKAGIRVVGLTYDSAQDQEAFKKQINIQYPILSDNNAASVIALGILNEDYSPGDEAYGIGHPGAFIVNPKGVIVGKIFVENYALRVDALSLLEYAKGAL
jgi:peroxiredoxin